MTLEKIETRLAALTAEVAKQDLHVQNCEAAVELAPAHRKYIARQILATARIDQAAITGRQQECESIWNLLRANQEQNNGQ